MISKQIIIKLLKSKSDEDNIIGYCMLKKKCKKLWIANLFYLCKHDIMIHYIKKEILIYTNQEIDEVGYYWKDIKYVYYDKRGNTRQIT